MPRTHLLLGGGALLALVLLVGVPFATVLALLVLLACPLMMLIMMRHMGHAGEDRRNCRHGDDDTAPPAGTDQDGAVR